MELRARHIAAACLGALALHGAVAALAFRLPVRESGAIAAGEGGLEIGLGAAGAAPGMNSAPPMAAAPPSRPESPPATAPDIPSAAPPPAVEPLAPERIAEIGPKPAATGVTSPALEAAPERLPETPVETVVEARVETAMATPVETAVQAVAVERPVAAPARQLRASEPAPVMIAPPPPRPPEIARAKAAPSPAPAESAPASPPSRTTAPAQGPASAQASDGEGGRGGSGGGEQVGTGDGTAGGGNPGEMQDFIAEVAAALARHKRYPRRARVRRQEGTGVLAFVMDREGRVIEARLQESSGHKALDREIMDLPARAAPLPAIPPSLGRDRIEIVVPISFELR